MSASASPQQAYKGAYFDGVGDRTYFGALDSAYEMLRPSAKMASLPMLYMREWNGLVEGPTWNAWWIQNSFGPSYTMMPFMIEPYQTWLANSQNLWFDKMGDGKRPDQNGFVGPVGCLCDAATPSLVYYRQGDGNVGLHDWCIGFTAAGLILESELMLVKRDRAETLRMLPKLEAVAGFLESRRDPKTDLLLGGVASNLLAPSFGGWLKPDGTRDKAYLSELSVNYVAGLNRLIEVCKFAGLKEKSKVYEQRRDRVRKALPQLISKSGVFIHALNPDGTKQGLPGAAEHAYFESAPNHDAMCFRVVGDSQAKTIYDYIRATPELRPHKLILPNCPSYDNMYETRGLFEYGVWVNGGHWTTAEARMMMGYYRVGAHSDALASFSRILDLAKAFRADNNLTDRGARLYQPGQPYNVVYDCWGAPGAFLRGLFEYEYTAKGLRLYPHVPKTISRIIQKFPVMFGRTRVYVSAAGSGPITSVALGGKRVKDFDTNSVHVALSGAEKVIQVQILMGGAKPFRADHLRKDDAPKLSAKEIASLSDIAPPLSGNSNRMNVGMNQSGGNAFVGQMKNIRIYRRVLSEAEVIKHYLSREPSAATDRSLLISLPLNAFWNGRTIKAGKGKSLLARYNGPTDPSIREGGLHFDGRTVISLPPSREIDFFDNFTIELWIRPESLPGSGSRLVDRCTVGGADGYNLDFINYGKTLRLINVTGVAEATVDLQTNQWQHVAATCDKIGLMRLYLNGILVGEKQGSVYASHSKPAETVDIQTIGTFYQELVRKGRQHSYAGEHAKVILELVKALQDRRTLTQKGKLQTPAIEGIPPANQDMVDALYVSTVNKLALGLKDWLFKSSSVTNDVKVAAKKAGLL